MVAHQIRVFGQVDGFECQGAEAVFALSFGLLGGGHAASSKFGAYAILTVYHFEFGVEFL